jgi:hypothetical protein
MTQSVSHHGSRAARAADVLIFGAGPAGIAAAVAAAREGCRVRLVELQNVIGGVISSCPGMMLGSGYPCGVSVGGFFEELVQRLYARTPPAAERRPCDLANFSDEVVYDYDLMIAELSELLAGAGVELLLNHLPANVGVEAGTVTHVDIVSPQGSERFTAGVFIDCTGNGDLAASAGVPGVTGDARGRTMGATLTFFMENVDWSLAFADASDPYYTRYAAKGIAEGRLPETMPQIYMLRGLREGSVYFNTVTVTGVDGSDPRSVAAASLKARRLVLALASFCRDEVPGFEHAYVSRIGPVVGVREGRRLEGLYMLTRDDVARAAKFEDGVVAADSPLDEVFRDDTPGLYTHEAALPPGEYYTIPFRTLVPQRVRNLLFAGRLRSVDQEAYATGRGMPQCMLLGQAAGVGAAMALRAGCDVQHIDRPALVERLVELGVNGIGGRPLG